MIGRTWPGHQLPVGLLTARNVPRPGPVAVGALLLAGLLPSVAVIDARALAQGQTFFAYAGATGAGLTSCPQTPLPAEECSLGLALSLAGPGDTVALATPGSVLPYVGNWDISTAGTTPAEPLTVEPAPGVSGPALDGNNGSATGCQTAACDGPVLAVLAAATLVLEGVTIENGRNDLTGLGGAIANNDGGTVEVASSTFLENTAPGGDGGAIDNGDGGEGTLSVSASTFVGNSAKDGGAIANGLSGGTGNLTVVGSTFSGNMSADGGAIDNGDAGTGSLAVATSTFAGNTASTNGGAIDSGDGGGVGALTATASTLVAGPSGGSSASLVNFGGGTGSSSFVAADIFVGSCQVAGAGGNWQDGGYNVGTDSTCFGPSAQADETSSSVASDLGSLQGNGGQTETMLPLPGNPAIALIPNPTTITFGGEVLPLCPAADQRGVSTSPGEACNAGAVQLATLTVSAPTLSVTYGSSLPGLLPTYSGFINGDSVASLTASATCSTTATASSPVGTYSVTCTGAAGAGYNFVYASGTLTVIPAALLVSGPSEAVSYGSAPPVLEPVYSGFVAGDSLASLSAQATCSTTASTQSPVGAYPVICSGAADPNYDITYSPGTLAVQPAVLTVSGPTWIVAYGAAANFPGPTYSGFMNGDTVASLTRQATCSTTATSKSPVGVYPIICSGAVDPNYSFNYVAGRLTVGATGATVSAPSPTVSYGSALPALMPAYSGFVNGDTASSLTTPATCSTTVMAQSPVGTYPVTCSGAVDPNYYFVYVAGSLTIRPAMLLVSAPSETVTYGSAVPALPPVYSGFMAGDSALSMTAQATCATTATSASSPGTYAVTCSGAVDANYSISYRAGTLTVQPATVSVAAPNISITYGSPIPGMNGTYSGFVNGDSVTSLITEALCSTTATPTSPVGTYPVTCSGAVDPNYSFVYVAGALTITPASLLVSAPSPTTTYGSSLPGLLPEYSGLDSGDTAASLNYQATCSTTATPTSPVGTYPVTCSGAADPDYNFTYVAGTLKITPASLMVSAPSLTVTYGSALPALLPTYSGFAGGDSVASLAAQAVCSTTATSTSPAGTYPITCAGVASPNYTFSYVPGTLTIDGAISTGPTSPGPISPGPTTPGPTSPGPTSPGPTSPGPTSPGPTSPGPTSHTPTSPGAATSTLTYRAQVGGSFIASTPDGQGWWILSRRGTVTAHGTAVRYGGLVIPEHAQGAVGIAPTQDAKGYWIARANGSVRPFGDARSYGSATHFHLVRPIVGIAATADAKGYWLAGAGGAVYPFGDARDYGSVAGRHPNGEIAAIATTPDGRGYWLVTAKGSVYAFGDAHYFGSGGHHSLAGPAVGIASTVDGRGYWIVSAKGGVYAFGDAHFYGCEARRKHRVEVAGLISEQTGHGYVVVGLSGTATRFPTTS
jgi:hypothetical protein